jgi:hypothetical protein
MSPTARSLTMMLLAATVAGPAFAAGPPAFAPAPMETKAIVDAMLFAFVKHFERAVNNRDAEAIDASFDPEALLDRVCEGLPVTPAQRRSFTRTVGLTHAAAPYLQAVGESGHIKMLRVREVDGAPRALYRLVGDDGLNYHDAVLGRNDDGRFAVVDAYVFATGELMSTALRRMLVQQFDLEHSVPPRADDKVAAAVVGLNGLIARNKWDEATEAVTRIEKAVGDDPYLDTLRAFFLCERGTYDQAVQAADRSIKAEPMLEEARLIRLRVALARHDFDAVAECLSVLERDFGWPLGNIAAAPAYQLFARSPSYRRWLARRERAMAE